MLLPNTLQLCHDHLDQKWCKHGKSQDKHFIDSFKATTPISQKLRRVLLTNEVSCRSLFHCTLVLTEVSPVQILDIRPAINRGEEGGEIRFKLMKERSLRCNCKEAQFLCLVDGEAEASWYFQCATAKQISWLIKHLADTPGLIPNSFSSHFHSLGLNVL